jgi:hypothetical protein
MQARRESQGRDEKQGQREALLRALRVVNLQVTALTEHMAYIEERMRQLERASFDAPANAAAADS